jgi:succinate dehydrogenase / fumarate reductase membrane anchor subunit
MSFYFARKPRESLWLWLYKILTGFFIVVLLGVHFIINHLVAPQGLLSYADVVRYYQVSYVAGMEMLFLVLVVSHALIGLRGIILDLNPSERVLNWTNAILILLGVFASIYGIWLILAIQSRG